MSFLPTNYEVPSAGDKYAKFKQGDNRFRILASPILGYEWWIDGENGRKPVRTRMGNPIPVEFAEEYKHFWAMPVWNYQTEKVQILEITQKSIQKALKALAQDEDWGSPINYDVVVSKSGEGLETEYQTTPKPAKTLDPAISKAFKELSINLEALYDGADPFADQGEVVVEEAARILN